MQPSPILHYLPVNENGQFRKICLSEYGPPNPQETILCLPGLLETSAGWVDFVNYFAKKHTVYVIDFAGRALSTYLPDRQEYRMSSCLADVCSAVAFINGGHQTIQRRKSATDSIHPHPGLHVVGNSIGGLLAITIAAAEPDVVSSVVINDVGAIIPWAGLVAIMGSIYAASVRSGEISTSYSLTAIANDLDTDPRLLRAVMRPSYADLDLKQNLIGMSYEKYFSKVLAPTLLVYSESSRLVTPKVIEATQLSKSIQICEIPGDDHPVRYNNELNQKIEAFILQSPNRGAAFRDEPEQLISTWFKRLRGKKSL